MIKVMLGGITVPREPDMAERALENTRQTLSYAESKTQSEQQSRRTKLMQAYLKQRLALLKKAAKKRIDTAGV